MTHYYTLFMHKKYFFEVKNEFGHIVHRSEEIYNTPEEAQTTAAEVVADLDARAARDEKAYLKSITEE